MTPMSEQAVLRPMFKLEIPLPAERTRENLRQRGILKPWAYSGRERELFAHLSGPMGRVTS